MLVRFRRACAPSLVCVLLATPLASGAELRAHLEGGGGRMVANNKAWQSSEIGPGLVGALSVELGLGGRFGIEGRLLGARFLRGEVATRPGETLVEETGLAGLALGMRLHPFGDLEGLALGAAFGGVRTGSLTRAAIDLRLGWDFRFRSLAQVGPYVGYLHVVQPNDPTTRNDDARVLIFGLHVGFDDLGPKTPDVAPPPPTSKTPEPVVAIAPPPAPAPLLPIGCSGACPDPLHAGALAVIDKCPNDADVFIGPVDADGCMTANPDAVVIDDRIALRVPITFAAGSVVLTPSSRDSVDVVAALMLAHPEIARVKLDVHPDDPGSEAHNRMLAAKRAAVLRARLLERGVAAARVLVVGHGRIAVPPVNGIAINTRRVVVYVERTP